MRLLERVRELMRRRQYVLRRQRARVSDHVQRVGISVEHPQRDIAEDVHQRARQIHIRRDESQQRVESLRQRDLVRVLREIRRQNRAHLIRPHKSALRVPAPIQPANRLRPILYPVQPPLDAHRRSNGQYRRDRRQNGRGGSESRRGRDGRNRGRRRRRCGHGKRNRRRRHCRCRRNGRSRNPRRRRRRLRRRILSARRRRQQNQRQNQKPRRRPEHLAKDLRKSLRARRPSSTAKVSLLPRAVSNRRRALKSANPHSLDGLAVAG